MRLVPKDWAKFQHYRNRRPPWIKLHRHLLDNQRFMCLPLASRALAPMLWLIAAEEDGGVFDTDGLAWRLRCDEVEVSDGLRGLCEAGLFLDASTLLAPCLQVATSEESRERDREEKRDRASARGGGLNGVPKTTSATCPDDVDAPTWADWQEHRRKLKAPITATGMATLRTEAGKAGMSLQDAMATAMANGWRGFRADWVRKPGTKPAEAPRNVTPSALSKAVLHDPDNQACECERCYTARRRAAGYGEQVKA